MAVATRARRGPPPDFGPYDIGSIIVPDIMEWIVSDEYLDRPQIYPRQATLLKTIFLRDDLFTSYDEDVLAEWADNFEASADELGEGYDGIQPDIWSRIEFCKQQGRPWFREVLAAIGRRGSKGYLGGIAGSYILWNFMSFHNPQEEFGLAKDKKLAAFVFSSKREHAKENQWKDLTDIIRAGPCFAPYISMDLAERMTVRCPADKARAYDFWERGIETTDDLATFRLLPREATRMAGRGPAAFMEMYDEMAHIVKEVAKASAEDIYSTAVPALDQFDEWAWIYEPSSTWQKAGQFYTNFQKAVERDRGRPAYPEMMMVINTSWGLYEDWEIAHTIPMWPGGPKFKQLRKAIEEPPEKSYQMRSEERANPETFAVERRSRWAASLDAYLKPDVIREVWKPWPTETNQLQMTVRGQLNVAYRAHGDPSKSNANFGFAIAHVAGRDDRGLPHVLFDVITHWAPADFPDHIVDYPEIGGELVEFLDAFVPFEMTFDQFNTVETIQRLQRHVRTASYPRQVDVYERTANAELNWQTYETFKTALNLKLIHAPYYEQAKVELEFLQQKLTPGQKWGRVDAPTSGPVQTKDVADCMAICTYELIGEEIAGYLAEEFSSVRPSGSQQGGADPYPPGLKEDDEDRVGAQLSGFGRSVARAGRRGAPRRRQG